MSDSEDYLTIDLSNLDRPLESGDLLRIEHRDGTQVLVQVLSVGENPPEATSGEGEHE
jgi:hypothetical protein